MESNIAVEVNAKIKFRSGMDWETCKYCVLINVNTENMCRAKFWNNASYFYLIFSSCYLQGNSEDSNQRKRLRS